MALAPTTLVKAYLMKRGLGDSRPANQPNTAKRLEYQAQISRLMVKEARAIEDTSMDDSVPPATKTKIGVLALQGAFLEHVHALNKLDGIEAVEVRTPADLVNVAGIVIPGGESTTIENLARRNGLWEALTQWITERKPVFGTCAGLILLSNQITGHSKAGQTTLGGIDVTTDRNAYGRQTDSFRAPVQLHLFSDELYPGVFIRAPGISEIRDGVEVLATLERDGKSIPVAVRQGPFLGCTFHPELTTNSKWHELFKVMCVGK